MILTRSRNEDPEPLELLSTVSRVNRELDKLTNPPEQQRYQQHLQICEAVSFPRIVMPRTTLHEPYDSHLVPGSADFYWGAIVIGDFQLVHHMVEKFSREELFINVENPRFGRPLQVAAAWGHISIVQYLLNCGADPNEVTGAYPGDTSYDQGNEQVYLGYETYRSPVGSALRAAALSGHEDIVRLLLLPEYRIATSSREYYRAILAAVRAGNIEIIHLLVDTAGKRLRDLGELRETMFLEAVRHNRADAVKLLLDDGVDVNTRFDCPGPSVALHIAASKGFVSIVRILLIHGARMDIYCSYPYGYPIEAASYRGHEDVVEVLLHHGATLEQALITAADGGQAHMVRFLLEKGVNVRAKPHPCTTAIGTEALNQAVIVKNPTIIKMLLEAGVPLNHDDPSCKNCPLVVAKSYSAPWIVDFLFSMGAEDREFDPRDRMSGPDDEHWSQTERGFVKITERTWQWVGKY